MNSKITLALLMASPCVFGANLPDSLLKQLPLKDHSVITFSTSDFDKNGLTDYIIVLRDNKEINSNIHVPRTLYAFMQVKNDSYKLIGKNNSVVYAKDEGGIGGDPFDYTGNEGITAKGRYFTVENAIAGGIHWTDFITFKYNPLINNFQFHLRVLEDSQLNSSNDPSADALVVTSHKEFKGDAKKTILLSEYIPF
jgi:hypothetical protein